MSRQRCAGRLGGKAEIPCGLKRGMGHRRCAGWMRKNGESAVADSPFWSELCEFSQVFVVFAVFAVFGDKWLVGVGTVVFDVDDSGGDHFYQGEAFA